MYGAFAQSWKAGHGVRLGNRGQSASAAADDGGSWVGLGASPLVILGPELSETFRDALAGISPPRQVILGPELPESFRNPGSRGSSIFTRIPHLISTAAEAAREGQRTGRHRVGLGVRSGALPVIGSRPRADLMPASPFGSRRRARTPQEAWRKRRSPFHPLRPTWIGPLVHREILAWPSNSAHGANRTPVHLGNLG
jgi:hypothetical protein